jgi:hypothetical protein
MYTSKMNDVEISALKEQIKRLEERLTLESENTTYHIKEIHKHISTICDRIQDIHDYLWPLVGKIFPKFARDARRIAELGGDNPEKNKNRDK